MFLLGCCFACRQLKNQITWLSWCLWIVVLEKTHESSLDIKDIKLVNPKGNQLWIFIGRIDPEAEAPILWLPEVKSRLTGKDPDAGKDWGQEEKGMTEDEMVRWHHWLNGHELEQALVDSEGQGKLVLSMGSKELDMTGWLNSNIHLILCSKMNKLLLHKPRQVSWGNHLVQALLS